MNEEFNVPEAQEETIVITDENIEQALHSKNFKMRMKAYESISRYPSYIGELQNETNIPALEVALSSLNDYEGVLTNDNISKLYLMLSQPKPTLRNKLNSLIDRVYENDKSGVIEGLSLHLEHETPKIVERIVSKLNEICQRSIEDKELISLIKDNICPKLDRLFNSTDPSVKKATNELTVTIYQMIWDLIYKYIENIKPIILNYLKNEFSKFEAPKKEIKLSTLNFNDPDWKVRLSNMTLLKECSFDPNSFEVIGIFNRLLKDANIQVLQATVECVKEGMVQNSEVIKNMIQRFKDKKANISKAIKETVFHLKIDEKVLIECLDNKNPDIKIGVLECLMNYENIKNIKEIGSLLDDSNPGVREKAGKILSNVSDLKDLTEAQRTKLSKNFSSSMKGSVSSKEFSDVALPASPNRPSTVNLASPAGKGSSSMPKSSTECKNTNNNFPSNNNNFLNNNSTCSYNTKSDFTTDDSTKNNVLEKFMQKYPYFTEKDWNKKIEALRNDRRIVNEPSKDIVLFLISSKESNFLIIKEFLNILLLKSDISEAANEICTFLSSKITEDKLKNEILNIYKALPYDCVITNILHNLKSNKTGKKFISLIFMLSNILDYADPRVRMYLSETKITIGLQEKRAFADLQSKFDTLPSIRQGMEQMIAPNSCEVNHRNASKTQESTPTGKASKPCEMYSNTNALKPRELTPTSIKRNSTETKSLDESGLKRPVLFNENIVSDYKIKTPTKEYKNDFNKIAVEKSTLFYNNNNGSSSNTNNITNTNTIITNANNSKINVFKNSKGSTVEECFTREFLELARIDSNSAMQMLESSDISSACSGVVDLYDSLELPSPYYNSFTLHLISTKYILNESEAKKIVNILFKNFMEEELELIDRIYPVTKLYRIYVQMIDSYPCAIREIRKLLVKYYKKEDFNINDSVLSTIILNSKDFIDLVSKIQKTVAVSDSRIVENSQESEKVESRGSGQGTKDLQYNSNVLEFKDNLECVSNLKEGSNLKLENKFMQGHNNSKQENISIPNNNNLKQENICIPEYQNNLKQENKCIPECNNTLEITQEINDSLDIEDSYIIENTTVEDVYSQNDNAIKAPSVLEEEIINEYRNDQDYNTNKQNHLNNTNLQDLQGNTNEHDTPVGTDEHNFSVNTNKLTIDKNEHNLQNGKVQMVSENKFIRPQSVVEDIALVNDKIIERSLENISISTTPKKKRRDFNMLEDIINKLIHSDTEISMESFKRLNSIISENIKSLMFLSNTIVGSIVIQLFDKYENLEFRKIILGTLLKLSQNVEFCLSLRQESLKGVNSDLIKIVPQETAAADILINLCLNCNVDILSVYFDLLDTRSEVILKLIWRHAKRVDYSSKESVFSVVKIVDQCYQKKSQLLSESDNVTLKVCLLHLKECCLCYSDGIKSLGLCSKTKAIIDLLIGKGEFNLDNARAVFK